MLLIIGLNHSLLQSFIQAYRANDMSMTNTHSILLTSSLAPAAMGSPKMKPMPEGAGGSWSVTLPRVWGCSHSVWARCCSQDEPCTNMLLKSPQRLARVPGFEHRGIVVLVLRSKARFSSGLSSLQHDTCMYDPAQRKTSFPEPRTLAFVTHFTSSCRF